MNNQLKVLILDDNPESVNLLSPELHQAGYEPEWIRIDKKKDYHKTFSDPPDLILAKYDLPKLDAPSALKTLQNKGLNIPFIVISESSNEKEAIECVWQGADNYVLRDHLARLGPAISQALDKKSIREDKHKIEQASVASEGQYRSLFDSVPIGLYRSTPEGKIVDANPALVEILGFPNTEALLAADVISLYLDPKDRDFLKNALEKEGVLHNHEFQQKDYHGKIIWVEENSRTVYDEDGNIQFYEGSIKDITERKRVEQALQTSEEHFRSVVESALIAIVSINSSGRIVFWNKAAEITFGYTAAEIIGKPLTEIMPEKFIKSFRIAFERAAKKGNLKSPNKTFSIMGIRKSGEEFPVEFSLANWESRGEVFFTAIIKDITERTEADRALLESEEKYRTIFDSSRAAIYLSSHERIILDSNQSMVEMFGFSKTELRNLDFTELFIYAKDAVMFDEQVKSRGFVNDFQVKFVRKDKSQFDAEITSTIRRNESGEIIGYQGIIRDVTARKLGERELEAMVNVSAALRKAGGHSDLLPIILDQVLEIVEADGAALALIDAITGDIVVEQARGRWKEWSRQDFESINQISNQILAKGKPFSNSNISKDPLLKKISAFKGVNAVACTPLIAQENRVGLIWIGCETNFSEEALRLVTVIGTIVANALHRSTLLENLERALNESRAIAEIGRELIRTLNLKKIFKLIVNAAVNIIPNVNRSIIHIFNENSQLLHPVAISSNDPSFTPITFPEIKVSEMGEFNFDVLGPTDLRASSMSIGKGIAGNVISEGKTIIVNDTQNDPRYMTSSSTSDINAMIVVPVLSGEKRLGTLSVMGQIPNSFTPEDQNLLEQLSVQATTAIVNARLYEAERIQRELTEAQAEIASAINRSIELDDVLNLILEQTQRVVPCEAANIMLLEEYSTRTVGHIGHEDGTSITKYGPGAYEKALSDITPILSEMISTRQPIIVNDTSEDPRWITNKELLWVSSYAGIPLIVGDQLLGFLNLDHNIPNFFADRTVQRLQAFADDAAIAVNNARLYREIENNLKQEQATRVQLLQADKLAGMGRMVASVAHELNNPLQTIKNCLFLLEQDMTMVENADLFGTALSEVERLSNIVHRLREVYRPKSEDTVESITIKNLLADVQMLIEIHLRRKNVIWIQDKTKKSFIISGITDQLKQVMINLSLNAIEAMQPDGGNLTVKVFPSEDEEQIGISFNDSGPGISPDFIQYVFDPFFTTKETGMGLGLSICYDIVQNHNGKITIESDQSKGATFTVWLPLLAIDELDVITGD
ncbi:MAG: PAS domain S-box protein [Chloroflexi bacterium]|nr:PAS domain S-box protein [Chloroflexota bacterium]